MGIKSKIQDTMQGLMGNVIGGVIHRNEQSVVERAEAVHANEDSPERFDIMGNARYVEGDHAPVPGFPRSVPHVMSSLHNIRNSLRELDSNPSPFRTEITDAELHELKTFAQSVGVDEIGFAKVPEKLVFRDRAVLHDNAVVLIMEMDKDRMEKAPDPDTAVMVHETYNYLGIASNKIARYLREKGFSVHSGHPLMGLALYPPLGQAAGLGWRGMHGLLITPQFGPRVRLAAVFTSIENLPFYASDEHAWIEDYCNKCQLCAKQCPADAVFVEPIRHDSGLITCTDSDKCFPYFVREHGCSVCIKVCPFNRAGYARLYSKVHHDEITMQPVGSAK